MGPRFFVRLLGCLMGGEALFQILECLFGFMQGLAEHVRHIQGGLFREQGLAGLLHVLCERTELFGKVGALRLMVRTLRVECFKASALLGLLGLRLDPCGLLLFPVGLQRCEPGVAGVLILCIRMIASAADWARLIGLQLFAEVFRLLRGSQSSQLVGVFGAAGGGFQADVLRLTGGQRVGQAALLGLDFAEPGLLRGQTGLQGQALFLPLLRLQELIPPMAPVLLFGVQLAWLIRLGGCLGLLALGFGFANGGLALGICLLVLRNGLPQRLDDCRQLFRFPLHCLPRLFEALGLLQTLQPVRPVSEGIFPGLQWRQFCMDFARGIEQTRPFPLLRVQLLLRVFPACSGGLKVLLFIIKLGLQPGEQLIQRLRLIQVGRLFS